MDYSIDVSSKQGEVFIQRCVYLRGHLLIFFENLPGRFFKRAIISACAFIRVLTVHIFKKLNVIFFSYFGIWRDNHLRNVIFNIRTLESVKYSFVNFNF